VFWAWNRIIVRNAFFADGGCFASALRNWSVGICWSSQAGELSQLVSARFHWSGLFADLSSRWANFMKNSVSGGMYMLVWEARIFWRRVVPERGQPMMKKRLEARGSLREDGGGVGVFTGNDDMNWNGGCVFLRVGIWGLRFGKMRVSFTITAENTRKYANMALLCAWSIRHRAGALADADIHVCFNDVGHEEAARILESELGVCVHVLPRLSKDMGFMNKYNGLKVPGVEDADWVVLLDCDTAVIGDLVELREWMEGGEDDFGAVPVESSRVWGLGDLLREYSGVSEEELEGMRHPWFHDYPYFNGGFFALRGKYVARFREKVIPWSAELHERMRLRGKGVSERVRLQWNRFWSEKRVGEGLVSEPYFSKCYGDQIALVAAVLSLGLRYRVWPCAYNWTSGGRGHGEDSPIRILHYLSARFGIDRDDLFNLQAVGNGCANTEEGERVLLTIIEECKRGLGLEGVVL